ncbi:DMT family transporter [Cedecea neteri]|uniref:DMT family transporter n=1 Tax=Cedecea neteri TaxID=158822 RepID=UPI002AA91D67|nr:DMT family transporter [Cedecea neteri]WPU21937.1 DMT family transporter [Cedecea neteri]
MKQPAQQTKTASGKAVKGILYGLITAAIWGGFITVSRQGIGAGLQSIDLAFLRYLSAGALLLPWLLRSQPISLAGVGWPRGIVLALLAGPLFVMVGASGYLFAPLAHGAVIQLGTLTLVGIVLGAYLLKEHLGWQRLLGLVILIVGLATTAGPALFNGSASAWRGDILFVCAGAMYGVFTVLLRRWEVNAWSATAIVSVLSGFFFCLPWLFLGDMHRLFQVPVSLIIEEIVVQGILSGVVALYCFSRAIHLLGAGYAALFPALSPGAAILLGIPLTGDFPTLLQGGGLLIVSLGLLITALSRSKPRLPVSNLDVRTKSRDALP